MPNTVYGPFVATNVVNGSTPANATWGNNVQTQASAALHGFNGDLLTPFVLSGVTCARNGTTLNQLDVTSGSAYVEFADSTVGLISVVASTAGQFTTSTPSTTYYLFLKNDGTWQWGTTSTGPTNSLAIAQATTDGSGNILVVTDKRTLSTSLFPTMAGSLVFPFLELYLTAANAGIEHGSTVVANTPFIDFHSSGNVNDYDTRLLATGGAAGAGNGFLQILGAGLQTPKLTSIGGQAAAGSLGAPPIVASAYRTAVVTTTQQNIINYTTTAQGLYRVSARFRIANTANQTITIVIGWTDTDAGASTFNLYNGLTTNNQSVYAGTFEFEATSGTAITVKYTDPAGTVNDHVSAVIERLA